jgi:hypothetical protein
MGFFHWRNIFGNTMALGSTQSLTEMSTKNISLGGKGGRYLGLRTFPPSCVEHQEASTSWKPQGLSRHVQRTLLPDFTLKHIKNICKVYKNKSNYNKAQGRIKNNYIYKKILILIIS